VQGRREWGGVGGVTPPPENKLSANEGICRQTKNNIPQNVKLNQFFGQYSLHSRAILAYNKEKWDKFCQFCEKLCYFVISGKFVLCLEKFWYVQKIFGRLKWYTDGGGEVVKNNFLRKIFFGTKGTNNLQQLCTMTIRSLHGLSANFTLTPPLFKPPRYGPD
jgi:hypothetical protein